MKLKQFAVPLVVLAVLSQACSQPQKKEDRIEASMDTSASESETGSSDEDRAMGLKTVHFAYNSSELSPEAKSILDKNAQILKNAPNAQIQIEGHCDQRNTAQYNLTLGDTRANAVRAYLRAKGVPNGRMSVISYGKERLLDTHDGEEAYAKNRRVSFIVTAK